MSEYNVRVHCVGGVVKVLVDEGNLLLLVRGEVGLVVFLDLLFVLVPTSLCSPGRSTVEVMLSGLGLLRQRLFGFLRTFVFGKFGRRCLEGNRAEPDRFNSGSGYESEDMTLKLLL